MSPMLPLGSPQYLGSPADVCNVRTCSATTDRPTKRFADFAAAVIGRAAAKREEDAAAVAKPFAEPEVPLVRYRSAILPDMVLQDTVER